MIILATTTRKDDDALETLAKDADILSFRGAELDVVERLVQVGRYFGLDFLVCVGGDDIFCEAAQVDELIAAYADTHADFLTIKGLPLGTTPYAVRYEALEKLLQLKGNRTTDGWERYFVDSGRFNVVDLPTRKQDPGAQQLRLTLDYPEDFQLISKIYDRLSKSGEEPPLQRVIDLLLHDEPQLALINRSRQSEWEAARPLINL